jgi:hypothetical protein
MYLLLVYPTILAKMEATTPTSDATIQMRIAQSSAVAQQMSFCIRPSNPLSLFTHFPSFFYSKSGHFLQCNE